MQQFYLCQPRTATQGQGLLLAYMAHKAFLNIIFKVCLDIWSWNHLRTLLRLQCWFLHRHWIGIERSGEDELLGPPPIIQRFPAVPLHQLWICPVLWNPANVRWCRPTTQVVVVLPSQHNWTSSAWNNAHQKEDLQYPLFHCLLKTYASLSMYGCVI